MKKKSGCPSWLGLSEDRHCFVYFEDRAAIVRKIFEMSIGGIGSYSIAKYLNQNATPPFPPSSSWDHTTIDSMLRNRATVGEYQPKSYAGGNKKGIPTGAPIPDYYPAVITEDVFQAAQAARRNNLIVGRGRKGGAVTNVFAGLTTCEYCGSAVLFDSHDDRKSLICETALEGRQCVRAGWSYQDFEDSVFYFLTHPAMDQLISSANKTQFGSLVALIAQARQERTLIVRLELVPKLRESVSELKLACGGQSSDRLMPSALIRRDLPNRFFRIRLWDGPLLKGLAISL